MKVNLILRLLAQQCLDHSEGLAQADFGSSIVPTGLQAATQQSKRCAVFKRARTQLSAFRQRLHTSQQGFKASVGSTYLASLQLIIPQPAFTQILRLSKYPTCVRSFRGQ